MYILVAVISAVIIGAVSVYVYLAREQLKSSKALEDQLVNEGWDVIRNRSELDALGDTSDSSSEFPMVIWIATTYEDVYSYGELRALAGTELYLGFFRYGGRIYYKPRHELQPISIQE